MQKQLLKISKAQTSDLLERLKNPAKLAECLAEVKKMLVIKQRLALDSEVAC